MRAHDAHAALRGLRRALAGGPPWIAIAPSAAGTGDAPPDSPASWPPHDERDRYAVVLETSGSTGRPRRVGFPADAVLASARAALGVLGGPGHWVLALPPTHAAGIQVLVRSLEGGIDPVVLEGSFTPAAFAQACAALDPASRHYTSLVPTQIARLAAAGEEGWASLAAFDAILVGGAALAPDLAAEAARRGIALIATYGATETCGGCVYDGSPLPGYEMAVVGHDEDAHPAAGRIALRGPSVATAYLDDPAASAAAFTTVFGTEGWFITPDLGTIDAQGRLVVLGRADDVVNSGGLKIAPGPVAAVLAALPGIRDALVFGVPDPQWGEIVVAALEVPRDTADSQVDPDADPDTWYANLRRAVRDELGPPHAPRAVLVYDALPRLALGKPDRTAVRELAERLAASRPLRGVIWVGGDDTDPTERPSADG